MTVPGRSHDDAAAAILLGDLTAALAGTAHLGFVGKSEAARFEQRRAMRVASEKGRSWPATTVVRFAVAPWGWADFSVTGTTAAAPMLVAVGVVAPGHHNISELALSHDIIPVRAQTALTGTVGVIAGAAVGGVALWPWWLDVVAAAGLGAFGATGQLAWYRARIRHRDLSVRRRADDPATPAITAALAVLTTLTEFFARYDTDMNQQAQHLGVQPIPLTTRTTQVPAAIHQALWELCTQATSDTGPGVLAATRSAAAAAVADVQTAWRAFDTFRPAPLDDDPAPFQPRATPAQNLQDLADALEEDRRARQAGFDDVDRINRRLRD